MKKFTIVLISLTMLVSASLACTLTVPGVTATQPRVTTADEAMSRFSDLATMPASAAITADGAKPQEWKP